MARRVTVSADPPHHPDCLSSSAADRNKGPLLEVLARVLPPSGRVLEIASGTGQHAVHFAAALSGLQWQPSDPDAAARASVEARRRLSGLTNVLPPLDLDVCRTPWPIDHADALVCVNMIHIAPWEATPALFAGAARVLARSAVVVLYGPYRIGGAHTAPSNEAFDHLLRAQNGAWGVRDLQRVLEVAAASGFGHEETLAMPANNHCVVLRLL